MVHPPSPQADVVSHVRPNRQFPAIVTSTNPESKHTYFYSALSEALSLIISPCIAKFFVKRRHNSAGQKEAKDPSFVRKTLPEGECMRNVPRIPSKTLVVRLRKKSVFVIQAAGCEGSEITSAKHLFVQNANARAPCLSLSNTQCFYVQGKVACFFLVPRVPYGTTLDEATFVLRCWVVQTKINLFSCDDSIWVVIRNWHMSFLKNMVGITRAGNVHSSR